MLDMRHFRPVILVALTLAAAGCREEGVITVRSLEFEGVEAVDETRLKNALATRVNAKVPLVGWELPWGRKSYFDRARFDADLKRIEAFYADRGYPDARVTAFDVELNDDQSAVDVTLTIDEGEPVRVASVDFVGFDIVPPNRLQQVMRQMPLALEEPRDRQEVITTHELAVNLLREHGYPYAKVTTEEEDGPSGRQAEITFTAQPGPLAHFGDIQIVGNESVGENVIRRGLTFRPGDLYRRSVVQESQRRLYGMELFQFVNIESLDPELEQPIVTTRVTVAEGRHQRVNFGVGYGTEEKARVDGEYTHVNFLGGARSAGVNARWSSLDRGVRVDFQQPYFFHRRLSFGVDGQQWHTETPAYFSNITGGKVTVTHRWNTRTSLAVSALTERTNSEISTEILADPEQYLLLRNDLIALGLDPTSGTQEGTLAAFALDFQKSTADNVLNARRGYQIAAHAETAGRLLPGSFNYHSISADGRHYLPVSDDLVFANRLQLGSIDDRGDEPGNIPFSKKYFLGGAASIRGWGRYEVSPLSASGLPLGGNTLMAVTSELRATLRGNLGGVVFLDFGNVWPDEWDFDLNDLRYAVGTGLRYTTPVGPIRFDVGYQLNPIEGLLIDGSDQQRRWRIHFSIGQAF